MENKNNQTQQDTAPENEDLIEKKQQINENEITKRPRTFIGLLFAILSALFLSIMNITVRKASMLSSIELTCAQLLITLVSITVIMIFKGQHLIGPKGCRRYIALRALFAIATWLCMTTSLKMISPSDSAALIHTNVIIVAIMSRFIFKEILSFVHIFCLFIAILGND